MPQAALPAVPTHRSPQRPVLPHGHQWHGRAEAGIHVAQDVGASARAGLSTD